MPKVSVIMGIYNTNNKVMVKKAIDSIINQSFSDFEFIICDDGSSDNTYEIVKEIISSDKRCILIKNNRNMGLAYSLNNCLKITKGEYIARMDADDISMLDRFEKQVKFLDNNPQYAIVGGNAELFNEKGTYSERVMKEYPTKEDLLFGTIFIHPSIMMRKDVLLKLNGYRAVKETSRCEDYDLWLRLYTYGYKGYNIQENIYKFREDINAFKRRKYKYRIDEAKVRYKGFKNLKLFPKGYIYVIKPLIVGLIPQKVLSILRGENK